MIVLASILDALQPLGTEDEDGNATTDEDDDADAVDADDDALDEDGDETVDNTRSVGKYREDGEDSPSGGGGRGGGGGGGKGTCNGGCGTSMGAAALTANEA